MVLSLFSKFCFIHIPKTAGTSVSESLFLYTGNLNRNPYLKNHDPLSELEKNNDLNNYFIFTIVRNPYLRTLSYFFHFNRVNNLNYSFDTFLNILRFRGCLPLIKKYLNSEDDIKFFYQTPMISLSQNFYLQSYKNLKVNKIYKFENLSELEDDFKIKLPKLNKGEYSSVDTNKYFDDETTELVNNIFNDDFEAFNYKKNITFKI